VVAFVSIYHSNRKFVNEVAKEFETYVKLDNCLRGAKIRDVDIMRATFSDLVVNKSFDWDKYYYEPYVRGLFELEIFGFLKKAEQYNKVGILKRGLLLWGKQGTGKTTLGKIVCNNIPDHSLIWITPEILQYGRGCAESIFNLYKLAIYISPVVLLLEDLDLFAEDRDSPVDSLRLGTLMNILDGINSVDNAITIATTNRLDLVEKAISNRPGRFDRVVEIEPLSNPLREKMLKDRLSGFKVDNKALLYAIDNTDGWTGAEIQELIKTLNLYFISLEEKPSKVEQHVTKDIISKVIGIMGKFGIRQKSEKLGFSED
jgi:SpoVK/Ycf46/Vps4 family AAA+-type ATPase